MIVKGMHTGLPLRIVYGLNYMGTSGAVSHQPARALGHYFRVIYNKNMHVSEVTTLSLLSYSLLLMLAMASPFARRTVPLAAVALFVLVPWSASLLAGALSGNDTETTRIEISSITSALERRWNFTCVIMRANSSDLKHVYGSFEFDNLMSTSSNHVAASVLTTTYAIARDGLTADYDVNNGGPAYEPGLLLVHDQNSDYHMHIEDIKDDTVYDLRFQNATYARGIVHEVNGDNGYVEALVGSCETHAL